MRDDLLERRLRSAFREEAGRLPFTITAAELERRSGLRGRGRGNGRLALLLAAAVAIGGVGVAGLMAGLAEPRPAPTTPATAVDPSASPGPIVSPSSPSAAALPGLDELMATNRAPVLAAAAHDPISVIDTDAVIPPGTRRAISVGNLSAAGSYRVSVACLGGGFVEYDLRVGGGSGPGHVVTCDAIPVERTVTVELPASLVLFFEQPTSFRAVVWGEPARLPLPTENPVIPAAGGLQELVRYDDRVTDSAVPWGSAGLRIQELGPLPARTDYTARLWCPAGGDARLIVGDQSRIGPPAAETEVHIACNGLIRDINLRVPQPNGRHVFVAAKPGTRWSLLVTSEQPPIRLADDIAGWEVVGAVGPELNFETQRYSFSSVGVEGGGPLMVALDCAGDPESVEVGVDVTAPLGDGFETFVAECAREGGRTAVTFATSADGFLAEHDAPAGTWTALTLLVPVGTSEP